VLAGHPAFDEAALLLDYGVEFVVDISVGGLQIKSKPQTPLRVRYRALGSRASPAQTPWWPSSTWG
jgi:hypothetical protein